MSWQDELDELRKREALARRMGGADKVALQHKAGRLTVRERIDRLLDAGSFHETGATTGQGTYDTEGRLVDRGRPGALLEDADAVAAQALRLAPVVASLCVHGDSPGAVAHAHAVRRALEAASYSVEPFLG